jgi:hypothetical protein
MWNAEQPNESQESISEPLGHIPPATETQLPTLPGVSFDSQQQATIGKSLAIKGEVSGLSTSTAAWKGRSISWDIVSLSGAMASFRPTLRR